MFGFFRWLFGKKKIEIERYKRYEVRIKPRLKYLDKPLKDSIIPYIGKVTVVKAWWICDKDEMYSGEFALGFMDKSIPMLWIASGDVEIIREIEE